MIDEKALEQITDQASRLLAAGWRGNPNMSGDDRDFMPASMRRKHDEKVRSVIDFVLHQVEALRIGSTESASVQIGQSGVTDGVEWVAVPREPSDAVLLAMLATDSPTIFKKHLRHPDNWPIMAELVEHRIAHEIKRYRAMLAAAGGER